MPSITHEPNTSTSRRIVEKIARDIQDRHGWDGVSQATVKQILLDWEDIVSRELDADLASHWIDHGEPVG